MNFMNGGTDGQDQQPPAGGGYLPTLPETIGLARLPSICSLTFDELQTTLGGLGKDFGSMNMDELLKNIWNAEESQMMASAAATSFPEGFGLQRQGSLTLPRTLSLKTVDEVWRDLLNGGTDADVREQGPSSVNLQPEQHQSTLGEMTLEEFLMKAGIMKEETFTSESPIRPGGRSHSTRTDDSMFYGDLTGINNNGSTGPSLGYPSTSRSNGGVMVSQPIPSNPTTEMTINVVRTSYTPPSQLRSNNKLANQQGLQGGGIVGIGHSTTNMGVLSGGSGFGVVGGVKFSSANSPTNPLPDRLVRTIRDPSSLSPVPSLFDRGPGKKGSGREKAVERRQKRMIKNRESAARSRARKQAYTVELEAEIAKLKEQNQELQKKQVVLEVQKNKALEMINQQPGNKKKRLRRTQTGPW